MRFEYTDQKLGSIFGLTDHLQVDEKAFSLQKGIIKLLWNRNPHPVRVYVDDLEIVLHPQQVLSTTFFQYVRYERDSPPLTAFLFNRVGLAGCDMGACAILPRLIGQGRASELLFTGRSMSAEEGERWGYFNRVVPAEDLAAEATALAKKIAAGPAFANGITKNQLNMEWDMSLDTAIEAEAQAQAICMQTADFERAYRAFAAKETPVFEGD